MIAARLEVTMLELKDVQKIYRTKAGVVNALDGVSLKFPSSGMVFISGKSGCGKTTLLNVIGGLDGIDGGEIYINDKNFSTFSAEEYDSYRNTLVGFVFQEYNLLSEYTVEYNIKIAMELQGVPVDEEAFEKLLKDMEIEDLRNRKPAELSGGQRQRVAIARALVKQPRIIMADEPTGALDSATGMQVLDTLKKLSKEKLVIVVSHDGEFAEKYADRIIHLIDGKVVEDITFAEKELESNVNELETAVIVREGSDLSNEEKEVLAKAVKERKKIEVTEKLCFREKGATKEVAAEKVKPIAFKKSKMKLKSSAYLGLKSLIVKPIRLLVTVLISAFAFAVFGLFDTVANFNTASCLNNRLKEMNSTMVATADYIVDSNSNDKYSLKVSDATIASLASKTGGVVKGIYDFRDNVSGSVWYSQAISELADSGVILGKRYYANAMSGFIEFDGMEDIHTNGSFKHFNYKVLIGRYPNPVDATALKEGVYEVAISSYLADSIIYYLNGRHLNSKAIEKYEDLIDCTLSVQYNTYKIVGIINCGEIPSKYDVIKESTSYNAKLNTLLGDYDSFINGGAYKCFFVAEGFREAIKEKNNTANIYYAGNSTRRISVVGASTSKELADYVYNSADYDENNVALFSGVYPEDGKIVLADNEVLVHCYNLENVFAKELNEDAEVTVSRDVRALFRELKTADKATARAKFQEAMSLLGKDEVDYVTATVSMRSKETGNVITEQVHIVGFYFDVDTNRYTAAAEFKLMMNSSLMSALDIYAEQGDYSQILFSKQSVKNGSNVIVEYLTSEKRLAFNWYNDSVLSVIKRNEPVIRQVADLFLYVAIALAAFSIFMLYNYISTSIVNKHRSIGVLRALGAGGKDVFRIFLSESLLIGIINGILANIICVVGCTLVNSYIMNTMNISVAFVFFGVRQLILIFLVGLITAILSSAIPIIRISKKKPVELIRRS